jgi:hypothetical protein
VRPSHGRFEAQWTVRFPDGRRFAFSILDDTDDSTLENVRPVYDRLRQLGLRTTKTVWPLECPEGSVNYFAADTLHRGEYRSFVRQLAEDGFELASHGATMESSDRERTRRGIEFLEREFGRCPRLHANHGQNRENLYWGARRFSAPLLRPLLRVVGLRGEYVGEQPDSPYFWGDLCREHFDYVRNFTFRSLDMRSVNPEMPYHRPDCPYVKSWFSTTDAPDAAVFRRRITRAGLDRLERDGGVCIVSTHLGKGFVRDGRLDPQVDDLLGYLARKPGWFVPVSSILDHLRAARPHERMTRLRLWRLELRFLLDQLAELASMSSR